MNSDAGTILWDAFKKKVKSVIESNSKPPAFILYTGDLPEHSVAGTSEWNTDVDSVLGFLGTLSAIKGIPVLYMPGNNDSWSGDYCPFTGFDTVARQIPYPYDSFHVSKDSSTDGAYMISNTHADAGYYTAKINGLPLRIICLNTIMWNSVPCGFDDKSKIDTMPGYLQMKWLDTQLNKAGGDYVYLAMHIPPGKDAWKSKYDPTHVMMWNTATNWQNRFQELIQQYKQKIAGIFFGHTHMDEFRLLYCDPSAPDTVTQVAISCPGLSVKNGNNPGFKIVYFDSSSMFPTDFITFYTNNINPVSWPGSNYSFSGNPFTLQGAVLCIKLHHYSSAMVYLPAAIVRIPAIPSLACFHLNCRGACDDCRTAAIFASLPVRARSDQTVRRPSLPAAGWYDTPR